ncbi:lysine N(6)-hydroxylase/L-ornithine N(5)-oxygenase family protein [Chengkuizengella axinellae]|uniref:L-lysine N6-monooxygenase MbtG n=1 Tax=Chengkuizengella axinellae TaxID=3064388 RepID=A0ABT9IZB1_9BACL|nr:SidA/IucD/PvdA family monooxygenase [Chengkuizengella sp. 2205SS18-9]MDP5274711.1 SidA/IucD/PvdA family monooxygenase [Chengkuizengella sp. 2205SS18-9]
MIEKGVEFNGNTEVYDVVGIGFGPSNLALAIAIEESELELSSLFFETQNNFAWHENMLMENMQLQVSFLKDLVTLRNPQSYYSFLNYLKVKNRLNDFINLRDFYPTRIEYNDYFCWVAEQFSNQVQYQTKVISIEPEFLDGTSSIKYAKVVVENLKDGSINEVLAKNVIVATGGIPNTPAHINLKSNKIIHTKQFLHKLRTNFPDQNQFYHFVVVGSGQSAAEIFNYLIEHYKNAKIKSVMKQFAFKQSDDSPFVNEIFHNEITNFVYDLPVDERSSFIKNYQDTNYSVVDLDLIKEIYKKTYLQKVSGEQRFEILPFMELKTLEETELGVRGRFLNREDEYEELNADAYFLATGYKRKTPSVLNNIFTYLEKDEEGSLKVERNHRVFTKESFSPSIYLQGFNERTHGLSDTLLSTIPFRARDIIEDITNRASKTETHEGYTFAQK